MEEGTRKVLYWLAVAVGIITIAILAYGIVISLI